MDTSTIQTTSVNDERTKLRSANYIKTSYNAMNDWMTMPERPSTSLQPKPVPMNWSATLTNDKIEEEEEKKQQDSLALIRRPEDRFRQTYNDLKKQIAYRYPNPGNPRNREGCVGGSWRHIKEVMGHAGNRYVCIDGLVSVYDTHKFNQHLQANLAYRPHLRTLYASTNDETLSASPTSLPPLTSLVPVSSVLRDPNVNRKLQQQEQFPVQRRGFYAFV